MRHVNNYNFFFNFVKARIKYPFVSINQVQCLTKFVIVFKLFKITIVHVITIEILFLLLFANLENSTMSFINLNKNIILNIVLFYFYFFYW